MPVYEYECGACGGRFEATLKFSDPALTECRICNSPNVRKLLSNTSFVLKGSGWYVTDYASGDRKKSVASDTPTPVVESTAKPAGCPSGACPAGGCPSKG